MRISFDSLYKSLGPFQSDDLNKFCVITGKNGSGKSQLIQLFKTKQAQNYQSFQLDPAPGRIQVAELQTATFIEVDYQVWKNNVLDKFVAFKNLGKGLLKIIDILQKAGVDLESINAKNVDQVLSENKINPPLLTQMRNDFQDGHGGPGKMLMDVRKFLVNQKQTLNLLKYAAEKLNKDIVDLSDDDIVKVDFEETLITSGDIFNNKIELIFFSYQKRRKQNDMAFFHKERYSEVNDSISDSEFGLKYPSPVKIINDLLSKYGSKYYFEEPHLKDFNENNRTRLSLKNRNSGITIPPQDLSSGESVIIDLILKLFQAVYFDKNLSFPDLIIMDEPDAYLHPEMSKLMIEVLKDIFVDKYGIQIIFTTHSPSTVAMAPDDCIYELKNSPGTSLKQISKDHALKVLLENIPTLSIDYKNHRQVFVESPTDSYYYQSIFNKIKVATKPPFDLYFISTGYGKSNCAQVVSLTHQLRTAGNQTCYGIIDWDNSNQPQDNIVVHGFEKVYSIENLIYNPLYLVILFIEEGCSNNIGELGFDRTFNQYDLVNQPVGDIQKCIEWFFEKIHEKSPFYKYSDLEACEFGESLEIMIPKWYNQMQGHDKLEPLLKKTFPSLNNAKYSSEGKLQETLTNIAVKCYPFIPKETFDALSKIANS
jgi:AAA15 family ATPase/GTPase